jgi:hypothetical protein
MTTCQFNAEDIWNISKWTERQTFVIEKQHVVIGQKWQYIHVVITT